jgi:hypothetical protein
MTPPGNKKEDKVHHQEEDEAEHWTERQAEESAEYQAEDGAERWPRTRVWSRARSSNVQRNRKRKRQRQSTERSSRYWRRQRSEHITGQ